MLRSTRLGLMLTSLLFATVSPAFADPKAPPPPRPAPRVVKAPTTAPAAAPKPSVAKPLPETIKLSGGSAPTAAKPPRSEPKTVHLEAPHFAIEPQVSDRGLKMRVDPETGRIVLSGVARGPRVDEEKGEEFSSGVSFQVDHDKMPDFSQDPDYTRKNRWYFAHVADTSTWKGEPALVVAQRLADNLNKGGAYKATVSETKDGDAAIDLERR